MNTATISLAVTPTVISTLLSHYFHRGPRRQKPTAHISYDEGLHLIRAFLSHASRHTVEELQAFTSQWVPHPQWVRVDEVEISESELTRATSLIADQLGSDGLRRVGGREWWQWRKPKGLLKAEWIEMKADYQERKRKADPGNRVMLYVHGGAYFFGSVDEHRYQIQRYARKLKARALAPRYRLAPQFPFPCGLQDCLATYLYLLTQQEPNTIVLAGDSAGGGMVLSLLVILRDRGIPLPAGAVLISPWFDLTHSFPSVSGECPLDYIPAHGFHHKPSIAWPPPDEDELAELKKAAIQQKQNLNAKDGLSDPSSSGTPTIQDVADTTTRLSLVIDGEKVDIKEQIQIYTTNDMLAHPLVSPVMQPTLGGLPPLLIMVGGGEMLRDEQIYVAHKCADPSRYLPAEALLDDLAREQIAKYPPTDVQLQVWDDLCHVAPTLSFTSPAKFMYRSVAQFSAWCLARAQKTEIDILDDDRISVISASSTGSRNADRDQEQENGKHAARTQIKEAVHNEEEQSVGKAGDPLPPFKNNMIRQRVTFHGKVYSLPPPEELPGCKVERDHVGVIKVGPVRKWLQHKRKREMHFRQAKKRIHEQRLKDMAAGYEVFPSGDVPPPSALAGRRKIGGADFEKKKSKGLGLSLWSLWGSKHDQMTVQREHDADANPEVKTADATTEGAGARTFSDIQKQDRTSPSKRFSSLVSKKRSHRRLVKDDRQVQEDSPVPGMGVVVEDVDSAPAMPVGHLGEKSAEEDADFLWPGRDAGPNATGKRVFVGGLATPFSLGKDADTASMITLLPVSRPTTPGASSVLSSEGVKEVGKRDSAAIDGVHEELKKEGEKEEQEQEKEMIPTPFMTPMLSPSAEKPPLERFVTAEEVPLSESKS